MAPCHPVEQEYDAEDNRARHKSKTDPCLERMRRIQGEPQLALKEHQYDEHQANGEQTSLTRIFHDALAGSRSGERPMEPYSP